MKRKWKFRLVSLLMLVIAVIFVLCAVSNPQLGRVIYIGNFAFGGDQWRVCYAIYVIAMIGLFVASFFVREGKKKG